MHRPHLNPNAEVSTSLRVYEQYSLDRAYMGEVFFWGVLPQYGDTITIKFLPPITVEKYVSLWCSLSKVHDFSLPSTPTLLPSLHSLVEVETSDEAYCMLWFWLCLLQGNKLFKDSLHLSILINL